MIFSWGVATTLCPLISMMRCPTRTPPLSAMPPRIRLQIWGAGSAGKIRAVTTAQGHAQPPPQTLSSVRAPGKSSGRGCRLLQPMGVQRGQRCPFALLPPERCAELEGKGGPRAFVPPADGELSSPHPPIEPSCSHRAWAAEPELLPGAAAPARLWGNRVPNAIGSISRCTMQPCHPLHRPPTPSTPAAPGNAPLCLSNTATVEPRAGSG